MDTLAICPWTGVRTSTRVREAEVARPVLAPAPLPREESPLLNANAAEALILAFSPIEEDRASRRVIAYVLDDGTVVADGEPTPARGRFSNGRLNGRNWTLWWERRAQVSEL